MKKPSFVIILLIGIIILLSIVHAGISNRLSTKGVMVGKIEEEISYYQTQNSMLSEEFLSYISFVNLSSKASKLGFAKARERIVLNSSPPLAVRP